MAASTIEPAGRALLERTLAGRAPQLRVVVLPAPAAPLTVLPATLGDEPASLWHHPDDRSFSGAGVAAVVGDPRELAHVDAQLLLAGGFAFAPGWTDACWESFGDGGFVLHRWTYERGEQPTLTLAVDASASTGEVLAEYDRIAAALAAAADDRLFPAPETAGGVPARSLRQLPMVDWIAHLRTIQQELAGGDFVKLVAARRCDVVADGLDATAIVSRLAHDFDHCTAFLFRRGDRSFVGATPETLFSTRGRIVESQALAGSLQAQGGRDNREALLAHSRKNLGEHEVVVRAIVDGLREHCVAIEHPPGPEVVHVRNLIHLSTPIRGTLRDGVHPVDLLETLHPTPAVGGVPRRESIRWIVEHEQAPRGWYTGPIGWADTAGNATFRVAIRCGVVAPGVAHVYTGAGIVADSNPAAEYHETSLKQRPLLRALGVLS
jgi:menaquinone-specific isochorismate synthase